MSDLDESRRNAAEHRLVAVEQRLVGLQEMGCDISRLRARLAEARLSLHAHDLTACDGITEEVLAGARRMATEAGQPGTEVRRRSDRRWRTPAEGTPVPPSPAAASEPAVAGLADRLEHQLAAFQTASAARLEELAQRLDERLAGLPATLDGRLAAQLASTADELREEWRHDLARAEQRLRAAMAADLATQREGAAALIRGLDARVDERMAAAPDAAAQALAPKLDALAGAPAAVEERLAGRLGEIAMAHHQAVAELGATTADLSGRLDGVDGELAALRQADAHLGGRIDEVAAGIEAINGTTAGIEDRLTTLDAGAADLGTRLGGFDGELIALRQADAHLGGRIDEVAAGIEALKGAEAGLGERLAEEAGRLAQGQAHLDGRVAELDARGEAIARRLDEVATGEAVLDTVETRLAGIGLALDDLRNGAAALGERLEHCEEIGTELQSQGEEAGARLGNLEETVAGLQGRLDEREEDRPAIDSEALAGLREELLARIEQGLGALAPVRHEATGVVAKAVSTLPTREDLQKLGDQLRADMDWKLERLSAEQGWVTVSDVQALLRSHPGAMSAPQPGTGAFPRLEAALTEFVRQLAEQQERFLAAVGAGATTARLSAAPSAAAPLASDPAPVAADAVSEELMAALAAIPGGDPVGDPPTVPMSLNDMLGGQPSGSETDEIAAALSDGEPAHHDVPTSSIHDEETRFGLEVHHDDEGSAARVVDRPIPVEPAVAGLADATDPISATDLTTISAPAVPVSGIAPADDATDPERLRRMIRDLLREMPPAPVAGADLKRALGEWLAEEPARTAILAVVATEAVKNPGALAELTGLRAFLRGEVERALAAAQTTAAS